MSVKIISLTLSLLILLFVVELVRRDKLTFKYAFAWMVISVLAVLFTIFEKALFKIAFCFGFELPSNFIFFSILSGLIFLSLLLTIFLCQQNRRNDSIAQKLALLDDKIQKLKN
jgi:hypothetical protein